MSHKENLPQDNIQITSNNGISNTKEEVKISEKHAEGALETHNVKLNPFTHFHRNNSQSLLKGWISRVILMKKILMIITLSQRMKRRRILLNKLCPHLQ